MPASNSIITESLDSLMTIWNEPKSPLNRDCLFVHPLWLKAWWSTFGSGKTLYICSVLHKDEVIGIAPLYVEGNTAFFIGDGNVCDYADFIVAPEEEMHFFGTLFDHLRKKGVTHLDLGRMRRDSTTLSSLLTHADDLQCIIVSEPAERIYLLELPQTWEEYLQNLPGKERHEIRRRLRRLHEAGPVNIRIVEEADQVSSAMDLFLNLFRMNIPEKSEFMTGPVESFFRLLAVQMAEAGLLRILLLQINAQAVAALLCFDHRSSVYLYNNGYDNHYRNLSVGFLSKVFGIKDSIQKGRKRFNFLKGDEKYKRRLGGRPEQLHRYRIELK
jgi:CelD/BcsL family acetyltransferase involved in cellulose biosynthesis